MNKQEYREKTIYTTKDYSMFKVLDGNRCLKDRRVNLIMESIIKVGYITSPILVNEKLEVIDGQGRLAALERLGQEVEFIVQKGIGLEECRQMNIHQGNWNDYDYVQSYAVTGNENYRKIQSLMDSFSLPTTVIFAALSDDISINTHASRRCRDGRMEVSDSQYNEAKFELAYVQGFAQVAKTVGGNTIPFYCALLYAYRNLDVLSRQRLEEVVRKRALEIPSLTKLEGFLKYFDSFYNFGQRKNKQVHLELQWKLDHV